MYHFQVRPYCPFQLMRSTSSESNGPPVGAFVSDANELGGGQQHVAGQSRKAIHIKAVVGCRVLNAVQPTTYEMSDWRPPLWKVVQACRALRIVARGQPSRHFSSVFAFCSPSSSTSPVFHTGLILIPSIVLSYLNVAAVSFRLFSCHVSSGIEVPRSSLEIGHRLLTMLDSFFLRSGSEGLAKAIHSLSGAVTTIFLFTRIWARTSLYKGLWWDDYIRTSSTPRPGLNGDGFVDDRNNK